MIDADTMKLVATQLKNSGHENMKSQTKAIIAIVYLSKTITIQDSVACVSKRFEIVAVRQVVWSFNSRSHELLWLQLYGTADCPGGTESISETRALSLHIVYEVFVFMPSDDVFAPHVALEYYSYV